MRLDHLLSKEHLTLRGPEPSSKAYVLRWELMGGTFDMPSAQLTLFSTVFRDLERWGMLAGGCTLLGPEGPGRPFGAVLNLWASSGFPCGGCWWGYRPYFENYTVDASILNMTFWGCVQ